MAEKDTIMKDLLKDRKLFLEFIQAFLKFDFVNKITEDNLILMNSDFETNQKTKLESDALYKIIYADKGLREDPSDERILKIAELIRSSIPPDQKVIVGKYIKSMFEILKKKEIITDEDIQTIKEATEVENMATALEVAIKKRSKWERQAGRLEGIYEGLEVALEIRFEKDSHGIMQGIRKINDLVKLIELKELIKKAKTVDEIYNFIK